MTAPASRPAAGSADAQRRRSPLVLDADAVGRRLPAAGPSSTDRRPPPRAERALELPTRERLLERQRTLTRAGRDTLLDRVAAHPDLVALTRPVSTALGFPRLPRSPDPVAVATQLRGQADVPVCPGLQLGAEGRLRLSHALDPSRTSKAPERIARVLRGPRPGG